MPTSQGKKEKKKIDDKYIERVKEIFNTLEDICKPYPIYPEVITSHRRKFYPTLEDVNQGWDIEDDPANFDSKEFGYEVVLNLKKGAELSQEIFKKLANEIYNKIPEVANVGIGYIAWDKFDKILNTEGSYAKFPWGE